MEKNRLHPIELLLGYIFKDESKSEEVSQIDFLSKTPFFKDLNQRQLKKVLQILHVRNFRENEFLFEYGNPGAALFFIQSGEVSIEIPNGDSYDVVTSLKENTFLGEIALLNSDERTASARALRKTECLALYRNDLVKLQEQEPEITSEIYKQLALLVGKRLVTTTRQLRDRKREESKDSEAA